MGPRSENNHADSFDNLGAATELQFRREVPVEHITNLSVQQPTGEILLLDTSSGWRDPIVTYLKDGTLPDDKAEVRKLQQLVSSYTLLGDTIYKKSYSRFHSDPYLRCLRPGEARRVIQEIHDDDCRNHAGGRSLTHKVINQGYYWP